MNTIIISSEVMGQSGLVNPSKLHGRNCMPRSDNPFRQGKAPVSGNSLSGTRMRIDWVLDSECNNRHVEVGYKVTSMLFVAKAVLG